jgi:hypothetical protein
VFVAAPTVATIAATRERFAVPLAVPSLAVTVTALVPARAVLCAVKVMVPVVPLPGELIWAVTPAGKALVVRVTGLALGLVRLTVAVTEAGVPSCGAITVAADKVRLICSGGGGGGGE